MKKSSAPTGKSSSSGSQRRNQQGGAGGSRPTLEAPTGKSSSSGSQGRNQQGGAGGSRPSPEPRPKKNEAYTEEDVLTAVTNANLQAQLMKFSMEKVTSQMQKELDEDLYRLQKEIEREQAREKELKYRLNKIKTNKKIEKLLAVNEKPIEKLVENLKAANVAQNVISKCDAISEELEKTEDKIACININVPENDSSNEELRSMIGETAAAYEELASGLTKQVDEKAVEALDKAMTLTEGMQESLERCEEGLKELQNLKTREDSLRIMVALEDIEKP